MPQKIVSIHSPDSPMAEAYRTLRTNIRFSSVEKKIQTIVVTSPEPGDGKTSTISNLATLMAMGGHKTVLIDCDFRNPNIHTVFELPNEYGLADLLIGEVLLDKASHETDVDNLTIITAGQKPPNPSELLGSAAMNALICLLKAEYEYILIDTPPVLLITDAQILTQYSDGCILVISSGKSQKKAVNAASQLLSKVNAKVLGVVLNKVSKSSGGYSYGKYHQYYHQKKRLK